MSTIVLNDYEKWLRANQCKETSMSAFFRTLRSSFNKAIADNHVKANAYPFKTFKISKFDTSTEKRAIAKESNKQIMNVNLNDYEKWLRQNQCKETSMSAFFRTLRSSFNKAIADNYVKADAYPFKTFKISKFDTTTEKRAIAKESNKQIMNVNLDTERKYIQLSKDLYVFSYLCGGINFADMANLQYSNISNDKLSYIRQKTGKKIAIPVSVEAMQIVNKYMKYP